MNQILKINKLVVILIAMLCFKCANKEIENKSGSGDIIKLGKEQSLAKVILMFEQNDKLKIYDLPIGEQAGKIHYYVVYMNRKKKSQVEGNLVHETSFSYDKFSYQWINDSTLKFKVFSSVSDQFSSFYYKERIEGFHYGWDSINHSTTGERIGIYSNE